MSIVRMGFTPSRWGCLIAMPMAHGVLWNVVVMIGVSVIHIAVVMLTDQLAKTYRVATT